MKKTTGIISLILVLALVVGVIAAFGVSASAVAQDISVTIDIPNFEFAFTELL